MVFGTGKSRNFKSWARDQYGCPPSGFCPTRTRTRSIPVPVIFLGTGFNKIFNPSPVRVTNKNFQKFGYIREILLYMEVTGDPLWDAGILTGGPGWKSRPAPAPERPPAPKPAGFPRPVLFLNGNNAKGKKISWHGITSTSNHRGVAESFIGGKKGTLFVAR